MGCPSEPPSRDRQDVPEGTLQGRRAERALRGGLRCVRSQERLRFCGMSLGEPEHPTPENSGAENEARIFIGLRLRPRNRADDRSRRIGRTRCGRLNRTRIRIAEPDLAPHVAGEVEEAVGDLPEAAPIDPGELARQDACRETAMLERVDPDEVHLGGNAGRYREPGKPGRQPRFRNSASRSTFS